MATMNEMAALGHKYANEPRFSMGLCKALKESGQEFFTADEIEAFHAGFYFAEEHAKECGCDAASPEEHERWERRSACK